MMAVCFGIVVSMTMPSVTQRRCQGTMRWSHWVAVALSRPKKGAEWHVSVMVRLQLLAEHEFSTKVINPFHHWTVGQESSLDHKWRSNWSTENWPSCGSHAAVGVPVWNQLPAGCNVCKLSHFVATVLQTCDDMEAALCGNCWTRGDVLRHQKRQTT